MTMKPRLSISTWSLHRSIGLTYIDTPEGHSSQPSMAYGAGSISLLDVPAAVANMGIHTLEIWHYHLPRHDSGYLRDLRGALDAAGVELFSLLIDEGDIAHPDHGARDLAWAGEWVDVAGQLGATCARAIAGKSDYSAETMARSRAGLMQLAERARDNNLRLMTENWHSLLSTPAAVKELLLSLEGKVGLCADFGNWSGPTKHDDLAAIFPLAESCHAKCTFSPPQTPHREDFIRCLDLTRAANFSGPYTLIYDGPDPAEWAGVALEIEMVRPYVR